MKLHVLTAVSRPENLGRVAESLAVAAAKVPEPDLMVEWHWTFDTQRTDVGGQQQKNAMLDSVEDGWVWVLDDDTEAHPDVLEYVWTLLANYDPEPDAIVLSQIRTDGRILEGKPPVRLGFIDIGQAFIKREHIGDLRIPSDYNGDFWWLEEVLIQNANVYWSSERLSLHNAISGVDVSV